MTTIYKCELTDLEMSKVTDWLERKWPTRRCPVCEQRTEKTILRLMSLLTEPDAPRAYPTVFAVCNGCANTQMFNAVEIGIRKGEE